MSETESSRLSQDEVYQLLSNPRRRFIISFLRGRDEIHLQDLAAEVAAWENETAIDSLTAQQRKRVYVSLYQTHVPKLEEAGIIDYDGETGVIRLRDRVEQLDTYLPTREATERNWRRVYLAIVVGGGIFYALVALRVSVFGLVRATTAGALVLGVLAAAVVLQYWENGTRNR